MTNDTVKLNETFIPNYQWQSESINELAKHLPALQEELETVIKDKDNPFLESRYADLATIVTSVRKVLPPKGFSFVQYAGVIIEGNKFVDVLYTQLMHSSGEWIRGFTRIISELGEGKKSKMNNVQLYGSGITYSRRYGLCAILGLVIEEEDVDGSLEKHHFPTAAARTKLFNEIIGLFDACESKADLKELLFLRGDDVDRLKNSDVQIAEELRKKYTQQLAKIKEIEAFVEQEYSDKEVFGE